jgi:serine/threonine protein kinase
MVFPYMDHDLSGLLNNPRVRLTQPQIKLYMKQLLEGTIYMHSVSVLVLIAYIGQYLRRKACFRFLFVIY